MSIKWYMKKDSPSFHSIIHLHTVYWTQKNIAFLSIHSFFMPLDWNFINLVSTFAVFHHATVPEAAVWQTANISSYGHCAHTEHANCLHISQYPTGNIIALIPYELISYTSWPPIHYRDKCMQGLYSFSKYSSGIFTCQCVSFYWSQLLTQLWVSILLFLQMLSTKHFSTH